MDSMKIVNLKESLTRKETALRLAKNSTPPQSRPSHAEIVGLETEIVDLKKQILQAQLDELG